MSELDNAYSRWLGKHEDAELLGMRYRNAKASRDSYQSFAEWSEALQQLHAEWLEALGKAQSALREYDEECERLEREEQGK